MAEDKKDAWLNRMSLTTVIFAVCATLSTFKGGAYSTQGVISQALASDQWGFYQAKRTKHHLYEVQIQQLSLQKLTLPKNSPALHAYETAIAGNEKQVARYGQEEQEIEAKARSIENDRDRAKQHGKPFGYAIIFLQVAILLNSVAGLAKNRQVWWTSVPVGLIGVALFIDGFAGFYLLD